MGSILFLLGHALSGLGQDTPQVKAIIDRNQILIGQPIDLTLEATISGSLGAQWFTLDSIAHFEFVDKGKLDSIQSNGSTIYSQHIQITSFDSGTRMIPSLKLVVNNKTYSTDSIPVQVNFSKINPNQDYHDIKDILDVENPFVKYVVWSVALLTVVALFLGGYFAQKKSPLAPPIPQEPISLLSAYDQAMQSLEELKKERLTQCGQTKLYYTRLNDILRLFVLRRFQMASLEKTNAELILQIRQLSLGPDRFHALAETLRMSDFVKFAKYIPDEPSNEKNINVMESSIGYLNEIEI
jgi:hypothetical protein